MSIKKPIEEKISWDFQVEEGYITSEKLVRHLNTLITNIQDEKYTEVVKHDIYDALEEYITGIPQALDPEVIQYLFRGWWLTDILQRIAAASSSNYNPSQLVPQLLICPYCIQAMPDYTLGSSTTNISTKEKIVINE